MSCGACVVVLRLVQSFVVLIVLALGVTEASARKVRLFHFGGGSSGEQLVKVLALPDIPALRRDDGRHVDLGYKFNAGTGGEWIGYLGSSSLYLPLDEEGVEQLLALAGISELPPVPVRAAASGGGAGWGLGMIVVVGLGLFKFVRFLTRGGAAVGGFVARKSNEASEQEPEWQRVAVAQIDTAAARSPSFVPARGNLATTRTADMGCSTIPARGFGRRG